MTVCMQHESRVHRMIPEITFRELIFGILHAIPCLLARSPPRQEDICEGVPCRWKLLPDIFLGILLAKKLCITYSFIVDNPNILGNFLLFLGQDQLTGPVWERIA